MNIFSRTLILVASLLLLSFLAGCQNREGDTDLITPVTYNPLNTGKVAVVLTDAPNPEFSEVNITITKISLFSESESESTGEDDGSVVVFEGEETVNLLALENYGSLFALSSEVPLGSYSKIRLTLKKENGIELVKRDENNDITEVHYPKLTGNAKLDLNPRESFEVVADKTLFIQLDIDAKKSINIVKTGNGKYKFRPVVFIDVISPDFSGKLVRHDGYIRAINADAGYFSLCDKPFVLENQSSVSDLCFAVDASNTVMFNEQGEVLSFSTLSENQYMTVTGHIQPYQDNSLLTLEVGKIQAKVVHIGAATNFVEVDGQSVSAVNSIDNTFTLRVNALNDLTVYLQNATRVFSRQGDELSQQDIQQGRIMEVHGVVDALEVDHILATFIVLDTIIETSNTKLSGIALASDNLNHTLTMTTATGDRLINVTSDALVLRVDTSASNSISQGVTLNAINLNDRVEVFGVETSTGEFVAELVLVVSE